MKNQIKTFLRYREFIKELVIKGVKLKYRRSYLGVVWSLIEPLLTMIVLTVVFGTLLGNTDRTYPVFILCGRLLFSMFSTGTNSAMRSISSNAAMLKKVYVPKYMFPLSSVLFNYVIFLLSLMVLIPVSIVLKVYPTWNLLLALLPLLNILLLTLGVGLILSTYAVFFRDLEYLWSVLLTLIMYISAIFYQPTKLLESKYAAILQYNPLFCIIDNFRSAVFSSEFNWGNMFYSLGFNVVILAIGLYVFRRNQDKFILHI